MNENQQPNLNKNDDDHHHLDVDHQQVFWFIQVKSKKKPIHLNQIMKTNKTKKTILSWHTVHFRYFKNRNKNKINEKSLLFNHYIHSFNTINNLNWTNDERVFYKTIQNSQPNGKWCLSSSLSSNSQTSLYI